VRFAARFDFAIEPDTLAALRDMAPEIRAVSPERIATEMQAMLVDARRAAAVRLLVETGLARAVLPEIVPDDATQPARLDETLRVLDRLDPPEFATALATLLRRWVDAAAAQDVCRRWRLSNRHTDRVGWILAHRSVLDGAPSKPWSQVQRVLAADGAGDLVAMIEAEARAGLADPNDAAWCRARLAQPRPVLDPPPLATGDDLKERGLAPGPLYKTLLDRVRDAQLDGEIQDREAALRLVDRLIAAAATRPEERAMDKRTKKRIEALQQRLQRLRQQLAGAKKQKDDTAETAALQRQVAEAEAELAKLKEG
ncbi:MAG: hypothetical protein NUV77_21410, partial [Thermoguttaceae bacterium]|nr:hypothetical protein [Thermoguttaceae bacterium]